jgi:stalled ribosome rescue protein Dom34
MDHQCARVFRLDGGSVEARRVDRHDPSHHHQHPKDDGTEKTAGPFYESIARALAPATELLLTGPGLMKKHFSHFLESRYPRLAEKVVGVKTVDHPTDNQIAAMGKQYFRNLHRLGLESV